MNSLLALLRTTGCLFIVIGTGVAAVGISGWISAHELTNEVAADGLARAGSAFGTQVWRTHWLFWSGFLVGTGIVGLIAGAAIVSKRWWGFLLVSGVAAVAAALPWAAESVSAVCYAFEQPDAGETVIFGIVALAALAAFVRARSLNA